MYYSVITDRYKCIKLNDLEKIKMNHVFFFLVNLFNQTLHVDI